MPSANPKLEKQASTEAVDPIRQMIIVIEHKIRNLEKRKGKLESYKDVEKSGGELKADQKQAVAKYDEVIQTLDITRDMLKSAQQIANDALKQQKKLARKEALERMQQDISKVREVLLIQDTLMNMGADSIRDDFLAGVNGAVKVTEADLKILDNLYNEVTITHRRDNSTSTLVGEQAQKIAEHFVAIIEGKQREFEEGTSYNKLKELITSITQCNYFDKAQESEVVETEVTEVVAEVQIDAQVPDQANNEFNNGDRHIPPADSTVPIPNYVQINPHPVVSGTASVSGQIPVVGQPIPHAAPAVDSSYYANAGSFVAPPQVQQQPPVQQQAQAPKLNDVIGTPNFFFLQDSELDSPDVTAQTPIVTHIPFTVNAPIPTQTFTNQNFNTPPVVPQTVMYQHQTPPPDMSHIPGFANPNPPPPIPMPPSHQQPNMQYSPQHPTGYQQQPQGLSQITQTQSQVYDQHQQENQIQATEDKNDQNQGEPTPRESELNQKNAPVDWGQMSEGAGDWSQPDQSQDSSPDQQPSNQQAWGVHQESGNRGRGGKRSQPDQSQDSSQGQQPSNQQSWGVHQESSNRGRGGRRSQPDQSQDSSQDQQPSNQQAWGVHQQSGNRGRRSQPDQSQDSSQDQQPSNQQGWGVHQESGNRGRGGRRGNNTNGYNGRGRVGGGGTGGYQQNGRSSTGGGQGSYYRNESSNYQQNGFHQRNNWNEGNGGTGGGFKRGTGAPSGGTRGGERGADRGGRGQYRGNQRGSNRGSYSKNAP